MSDDNVPDFEDGNAALAWMESRLSKSWTDALDQTDHSQYEVLESVNLDDPKDVDAAFRKMLGI